MSSLPPGSNLESQDVQKAHEKVSKTDSESSILNANRSSSTEVAEGEDPPDNVLHVLRSSDSKKSGTPRPQVSDVVGDSSTEPICETPSQYQFNGLLPPPGIQVNWEHVHPVAAGNNIEIATADEIRDWHPYGPPIFVDSSEDPVNDEKQKHACAEAKIRMSTYKSILRKTQTLLAEKEALMDAIGMVVTDEEYKETTTFYNRCKTQVAFLNGYKISLQHLKSRLSESDVTIRQTSASESSSVETLLGSKKGKSMTSSTTSTSSSKLFEEVRNDAEKNSANSKAPILVKPSKIVYHIEGVTDKKGAAERVTLSTSANTKCGTLMGMKWSTGHGFYEPKQSTVGVSIGSFQSNVSAGGDDVQKERKMSETPEHIGKAVKVPATRSPHNSGKKKPVKLVNSDETFTISSVWDSPRKMKTSEHNENVGSNKERPTSTVSVSDKPIRPQHSQSEASEASKVACLDPEQHTENQAERRTKRKERRETPVPEKDELSVKKDELKHKLREYKNTLLAQRGAFRKEQERLSEDDPSEYFRRLEELTLFNRAVVNVFSGGFKRSKESVKKAIKFAATRVAVHQKMADTADSESLLRWETLRNNTDGEIVEDLLYIKLLWETYRISEQEELRMDFLYLSVVFEDKRDAVFETRLEDIVTSNKLINTSELQKYIKRREHWLTGDHSDDVDGFDELPEFETHLFHKQRTVVGYEPIRARSVWKSILPSLLKSQRQTIRESARWAHFLTGFSSRAIALDVGYVEDLINDYKDELVSATKTEEDIRIEFFVTYLKNVFGNPV